MASGESVEEGAVVHGINIDDLMKALNDVAGQKSSEHGSGCSCCG